MSDVDATNESGAVQDPQAGRRRILQVCGSAAGGVRAHLADCARLLAADGHDVIVEAPAAVLDGMDLEPARAEPLEIGPRPSLNDTLAVARLRRLGRRADVLHAHGLRAGALAALALGRRRRGRTRLVVTLHNLTVGGRLTTLVGDRLERLIARRADLVLAVSPDLAERARELGAPQVELAIIPRGANAAARRTGRFRRGRGGGCLAAKRGPPPDRRSPGSPEGPAAAARGRRDPLSRG